MLILSYEQAPDDDIDASFISDDYVGPLCVPQYAARFHSEQDLASLPLLHADTRLQA